MEYSSTVQVEISERNSLGVFVCPFVQYKKQQITVWNNADKVESIFSKFVNAPLETTTLKMCDCVNTRSEIIIESANKLVNE